MIAVVLLAGRGERISQDINHKHKSLIKINKKPILGYLIEGLLEYGVSEIIPVLGYKAGTVKRFLVRNYGKRARFTFAYNRDYEKTNNLYSLYSAKKFIRRKGFLIVNGDLAIDPKIIKYILKNKNRSEIAIDDSKSMLIDSPGTTVSKGRIYDLGRHIEFGKSGGYAIGLYKIDSRLSRKYLSTASEVLKKDLNAGFHDPLRMLFRKHKITSVSTKGLLWTDIDEIEDLKKIEKVIKKCYLNDGL